MILADDAEGRQAAEQDDVTAVRQLLVFLDRAGAADSVDRWTSFVILLESRTQLDHADDLVALEHVGNHLAVARLEDQERARHGREERRFGQRKQRNLGW